MTDEQMIYLQRLLAHQLKGIMFHSDMAMYYHLFGMREWCRVHYKQMQEEMKSFMMLNANIIDTYGQIIRPEVDTTRIRITNQLIRTKPDEKEIGYLHKQIIASWDKWESTFHEYIKEGKDIIPELDYLQSMCKNIVSEEKRIARFKRNF